MPLPLSPSNNAIVERTTTFCKDLLQQCPRSRLVLLAILANTTCTCLRSLPPCQRGWSRRRAEAEVFLWLFSLPRVLLPGA